MQRKATKKTRGPNKDEKEFIKWVKTKPCIECGGGPSIADHLYGSTFRHNKILIGMWAIIPLCYDCDRVKTNGSHNTYRETFGRTQAEAWQELIAESLEWTNRVPLEVWQAIKDWNR